MALEQFNLEGQVAIVTGAGKGVGQGIAKVLAEAGATVVGTARTESDIRATVAVSNMPAAKDWRSSRMP
jgi:7-alpha-hydroxysteroid dehydrogenase